MKISASIYSNKNTPLQETIKDLDSHEIDLFHVDCNDDLAVFDDIAYIRSVSNRPIDLHIITDQPEKYFPFLRKHPVEYVTFQYENLTEHLIIPEDITGKKGLGIITPTDVSVFNEYADQMDFLLVMATIPGQSGGKFDPVNFQKIRTFNRTHPTKKLHVDGGVNGEVSFILRNMGVYASVSGSFLFKGASIGHSLLHLKNNEIESDFEVKDFMRTTSEFHVLVGETDFKHVLESIEQNKLGFTVRTDQNNQLTGLISNADVRKGLLAQFDQLPQLNIDQITNHTPVTIQETASVKDMLKLVKSFPFPIMYLPVIDKDKQFKGIITFINLVKGEL